MATPIHINQGETDHRLDRNTVVKLTSWSGEPTIQDLKNDFEFAKSPHDTQITNINRWNDLMRVRGSAAPPKIKGRSSVQPKLIRRQAEWRYAALSEPFQSSNKLFTIKPVTFEDEEAAKQNELVLNWQFRTKINRVQFIDNFIRSTVDEGTSIIRVGWERIVKKVKKTVPVFDHFELDSEERVQLFQQAVELKEANPKEYDENVPPEVKAAVDLFEEDGSMTYAVQKKGPEGTSEVTVDLVVINKPTLEIVNPQNFYIDPTCQGDIDKALFAIVSFETNQAELKKYPSRYKNLDKIDWEGNTPLTQPDHATSTPDVLQFRDGMRKKVVAYEYWGFVDIHKNGELVPIVATWIGDVMIRMEKNPFPDEKLPFVMVQYLPVKRELYGEPDAELLEDNQKILGAISRGLIDLMGRSANSQQGFAKGMLDPLNRRRYENGQDYEFNPNMTPANGLMEHKYPELPRSGIEMLSMQNSEAEALTGVKSFSGGMSGEAYGDVAAGIKGILDAAAKREMGILRRLAKGIVDIGNKIISMNSVFLSKEEVIRVTNEQYVTVKREDLKGNFDLETDISTAEVDNAKSQDLAFMLQTLGPKSDPALVMMILAEIAELKRMPALAEKLRNYKPQPSPEQIEMQKLEIEEKKKQIEKLDSEIQLNAAKAEQARALKDQADLDYVEQDTGTKHARRMQELSGQARGNQDLQVTKALTTPRKEGEKAPDVEAAIGWNTLTDQINDPAKPSPVDLVQ